MAGARVPGLQVQGVDDRYAMRAPTYGIAGVDPQTGTITASDYMPGRQDGWSAVTSTLFALHFGSFGGTTIRWAYFLMGLAGAMLFYTGNLLWVESRRKERKGGAVTQTRSTRILGALTVGVPLGCVAGTAVTLAAAKLVGSGASHGLHSAIYYAVFVVMTGWALMRAPRGPARNWRFWLPWPCCASPQPAFLPEARGMTGQSFCWLTVLPCCSRGLLLIARSARKRAFAGAGDSVWAVA
jgi:hypothetical protein